MPCVISIPPPSAATGRDLRPVQHVLLYFVAGNPGIVAWYGGFLRDLSSLLASISPRFAFHIYARDLLGFSSDDHAPFTDKNPPFDLGAQIRMVGEDVAAQRVRGTGASRDGQPFDLVILMGHSVGAYITVEVFHRHMLNPTAGVNLAHGILLFPTVTHIAQAPAGRVAEFIQLRPWLSRIFQATALSLVYLLRRSWLWWFAHNILGHSATAADVTAGFLSSRNAVLQSIHMGWDEMKVIAEDKWPEELWEAAADGGDDTKVPRFFLFFGRNDHWVSNHVRQEFIKHRNGDGKVCPRIVVDEGDLPHAFSTRDESSVVVAGKVRDWVAEIVEGRR